jgi:hypothetical protein
MELSGQHNAVAAPLQCLAHDLLGLARAVAICGVDEVDAGIQSFVDDAYAILVVGIAYPSEHHGAQAVGAHLDAGSSERTVLHGIVLSAVVNDVRSC